MRHKNTVRCLLTLLFAACICMSMIGCVQNALLQNEEIVKREQKLMMDSAESIVTNSLEDELATGDLEYYKIIETSYVGENLSQSGGKYNVTCKYEVGYSGKTEPMLVSVLEREFFIEKTETGDYVNTREGSSIHFVDGEVSENSESGKITYPCAVEFHPVISKADVEGVDMEEICNKLIVPFLEELCQKSDERTFRITEYKDLKVKSVQETVGANWESSYWYSGHDVVPEGAYTCWIPDTRFSWKYLGYISVYGYRGNAFGDESTEVWESPVFQDSTFIVVEWPDHYELYTNQTLKSF